MKKKSIIVLISGAGSTAKHLIDNLPNWIKVSLVITNNPKSTGAADIAFDYDIPVLVTKPPSKFENRKFFDRKIVEVIKKKKPDLIVLAGFMLILGKEYTEVLPNTINLHPALPRRHLGSVNGIKDSWDDATNEGGSIVHWVTSEVDGGEIINSTIVPKEGHTFETFKKTVQVAEKRMLEETIIELLS